MQIGCRVKWPDFHWRRAPRVCQHEQRTGGRWSSGAVCECSALPRRTRHAAPSHGTARARRASAACGCVSRLPPRPRSGSRSSHCSPCRRLPARATVPNANDDTATTVVDTAAYISVLDNDSDPDFEPIQVTGATDPDHGSCHVCTRWDLHLRARTLASPGPDSFRVRRLRWNRDGQRRGRDHGDSRRSRATGRRRRSTMNSPRDQAPGRSSRCWTTTPTPTPTRCRSTR